MLAQHVGEEIGSRAIVFVPFAGGMCELAHIKAPTIMVSDLHQHVINLASVCKDAKLKTDLQTVLRGTLFHPHELRLAQELCRSRPEFHIPSVGMAAAYFTCIWMSRSGEAGKANEFNQQLALRWDSGGGDSVVRFRNATEALDDFHETTKRCQFCVEDAFSVIGRIKDKGDTAVYLDPPFFKDGKSYLHNCGDTSIEQVRWHKRLRDAVKPFTKTRVVLRFHENDLVRDLYPETEWTWRRLKGRNSANNTEDELLITNGGCQW